LYLASGSTVFSYFADDQALAWTYPEEPQANKLFYAAPSVESDLVIFGDYGVTGSFFSPGVTVSVYAVENINDGGTAPEKWIESGNSEEDIRTAVGDAAKNTLNGWFKNITAGQRLGEIVISVLDDISGTSLQQTISQVEGWIYGG